jgi:hypothetical protein
MRLPSPWLTEKVNAMVWPTANAYAFGWKWRYIRIIYHTTYISNQYQPICVDQLSCSRRSSPYFGQDGQETAEEKDVRRYDDQRTPVRTRKSLESRMRPLVHRIFSCEWAC